MAWLINLLAPLFNVLLSFFEKKIIAAWNEYKEKKDVKEKRSAELEQAKTDLKKELEGAKDDAKAQEDAIDNFFKRTR